MNRKKGGVRGGAGRCLPRQRPHTPHFLRRQQHEAETGPAMAATASAAWRHPGGRDKVVWKVLVVSALLQTQLPGTGKAGQTDGEELSETLCAVQGWGRGSIGAVVRHWRLLEPCPPQTEGRLSSEGRLPCGRADQRVNTHLPRVQCFQRRRERGQSVQGSGEEGLHPGRGRGQGVFDGCRAARGVGTCRPGHLSLSAGPVAVTRPLSFAGRKHPWRSAGSRLRLWPARNGAPEGAGAASGVHGGRERPRSSPRLRSALPWPPLPPAAKGCPGTHPCGPVTHPPPSLPAAFSLTPQTQGCSQNPGTEERR